MSIETQDEVLEQEEIEQPDEQPEGETPEGEQPDAEQDEGDAASDGEVVIGFGDDAPSASDDLDPNGDPAPRWLREMRKSSREKDKRIRELERADAARQAAAAPKEESVGEAPTLESCDYDAERYADAKLAWSKRKDAVEAKQKAAQQEQEAAQAAWGQKLTAYRAAGSALKAGDFEDAHSTVAGVLSEAQQAIILEASDSPKVAAQMVAALSRNPDKLKELASVGNLVKYTVAVAKLMEKLNVQTKNSPPPAERKIGGSAGGMTGIDNTEARLEKEADASGDRSKLIAYRRDKRRKQAA